MLIETTERTRLEADLALGTLEPLESRVTYIREADVQSLVGRGKTTKEIATVLSISTQTGRQRQDICRKLNLHSTPEVAAYAAGRFRSIRRLAVRPSHLRATSL